MHTVLQSVASSHSGQTRICMPKASQLSLSIVQSLIQHKQESSTHI